MQQESFLIAVAQIAVSLAGFSGLVIAIRGAPSARWHARDVWSLAWMLGTSLGALFLALLPLLFGLFRLNQTLLWRFGTLVMAVFMLGFGLAMALSGLRLTRLGHQARVRYFPTLATGSVMGVGLFVGATAVGMRPDLRIGLYATGLITCLLVSALSLVVFLVVLARAARPMP